MNFRMFGLLLVVIELVGGCDSTVNADRILISNVSIVDVDSGAVFPEQDVVIHDTKVDRIGPHGQDSVRSYEQVVDGTDKYLIPGLWDAHVHVYSMDIEPDVALPLYIAHGITAIRDMGALIPLSEQLAINEDISSGNRVGPLILNAGAMIDGPPGSWPGQMVAGTPEEGRALVREAKALGWPSVKSYSLLSRDTYLAIAKEADALNMPLYGHIPESVTLNDAVDAGHDVIEHFGRVTKACSTREQEMVDGVAAALQEDDPFQAMMAEMGTHSAITLETWDLELCKSVVQRLAEAGIAVAPTLMVSDFYIGNDPAANDPRLATVPLTVREQWKGVDFRRANMSEDLLAVAPDAIAQDWKTFKMAHEAGVPILASTDAAFLNPYLFHGATLHDELERYVETGLTPREALATATAVPARILGQSVLASQITQGRRADLVLLDRNPLDDISAVRDIDTVIAGGRVYRRTDINTLLAELATAATNLTGEGQ